MSHPDFEISSVEPATEEEVAATVTVMGGQDWELWMKALSEAGVLAEGCKTVAYSYIGTEPGRSIGMAPSVKPRKIWIVLLMKLMVR